jgi:hypothetical protein
METINKQKLLELAEHRSDQCISIYVPTHVKGGEVHEGYDPILFKNQIQKVRGSLQTRGLRSNEIEELLEPLEALRKDWVFWRYQREGLAVLRSREVFEVLQVPVAFEELCQINHQFYLRPLFPLLQMSQEYYILTLTQKGAEMYHAGPFFIEKMETEEIFPSNGIDEVLKYYELEAETQGQRQSQTGRSDGESSVYRGDKGDNKMKNHLLADYFRLIDQGVKQLVGQEKKPLVLACVEYYHPIYQEVNTYPFLRETGLTGNFEQVHMNDLHPMANELLGDYFVETQQKRITQYQNSSGRDLVSHDLRHILESAVTGRVETLFVRDNAQVWGRFDEQNLTATIHDEPKDGDEPLVDQAIVLTLRNGGEVYVMESVDLLPQPDDDNAGVAALYRF